MAPADDQAVAWLLASDPSIRWQAMRDLLGAPPAVWTAERRRVETEGWGAQLLSHQDDDGQWAGGAFVPRGFTSREWQAEGQPWTATSYALTQLREFGLDPASDRARRTVDLVGRNARWDEGGQPFWAGETEECINGRTVADGAYLGADVAAVVARLLTEQQPDGGWNCERPRGSVRSSFATTINVLEGLLEYERATAAAVEPPEPPAAAVASARRAAEEYLLARHLFRRLSTGEPADADFLRFLYPTRWRYDVLRALDYFRAAASFTRRPPDPRLADAVAHVRSKRRPEDGRWAVDWTLRGRAWLVMDRGPGEPSPWVTLRALRVLKWWDENQADPLTTPPPQPASYTPAGDGIVPPPMPFEPDQP